MATPSFATITKCFWFGFLLSLFFKCIFATTSTTVSSSSSSSQTSTPLKYEAPNDCQWWIRDSGGYATDEEVALACNLRTINSEFDTTNFSVIPSEHTTSLKIECSSELLSKSSLNDKSFSHLTRLRELILDYCKLGKWPPGTLTGLRDLRNLTIRTRNVDWPTVSLQLSAESFYPVKQLERLDLSTNNIWSLPENVFCPLSNLVSLNVSENRIQDVSELGFREKASPPQPLISEYQQEEYLVEPTKKYSSSACTLNTRILDASFNHFVLIPSYGFSILRNLHELRVRNNEISMVADRALGGLKNLKLIDLSNNKIVSLPLDLFIECADSITDIYLQNNSISVLSPRLFSNLNQLLSLDLSFNQLTSAWINNETFSGLIRLVLLNLSHNRISKLDPTLFHDLYTLQILNLEHNMLDSIPANTFTALNNLHTLILSYNKIFYLEQHSLNGLYALSLLSLDNNKLESVHPDCLKNCTGMQDLNLNGNKFTSVPTALDNMSLLKTLDLGENSILSLDKPNGFKGMNNLYGLRLIANQITSLKKKTFEQLPSLQILNLSQNNIKTIEKGTFSSNKKIEAIRVDSNVLVTIDGLFEDVKSLQWLNISRNRLTEFDYGSFPPGLQWLDVHGNFIESLENGKNVNSSLQTLDASFNRLTNVTSNSIPDSVEFVFLNDNNIVYLEPLTFSGKENLTRVDLYANEMVSIDLTALQLPPVKIDRPLPEFYIAGNPFQCDCTMEWLQRINKLTIRQHPVIMDIGNIYCKLIYTREKNYIALTDVSASQFLCDYKTHCYTLCQCCVFDACDCEMTCPNNCTCYHDQSWSSNIVDCSSSNYTEMPNKIPMDATEIYLDGNNFGALSSHSFIGRKNVKMLFANNSNIEAIYNYTFSGIRKLIVLHLEDNKMQTLTGFEFSTLDSLSELYLQNNKIHSIDNRTFVPLKNLKVLNLQNNRLRKFEIWQFISNPLLVEISLSRNPWSCDCKFVNDFRLFIRENWRKVSDIRSVSCFYNNASNNLSDFLKDSANMSSCISFFGAMAENRILKDYLPFLLLVTSIFLISVVLFIGIFVYRKELHLCMYSRCGFRSCYKATAFTDDTDHERLFDAYVAYCIKDEDFVTQILCSNLEQCNAPYRLCLHYRDFNVSSYVADTIIEAAESSKRIVLVLSRNFLHTEWCRFEYRSALREVLRDRRNKTIFVVLGEIPQKDLDSDLRLYLKINTCIQWGDNLFWQKLKYALPDVKECTNFSISPRNNSSNVYATPYYNYHNNGNISINGRRCNSNYPSLPPPPPQYSSKTNSNEYNGPHSTLPKTVNLHMPWT